MFQLGYQNKVVFEQLPYRCAERMVDNAELFSRLHLNKGFYSAIICGHFEHCRGEITQGRVETVRDFVLGTEETIAFFGRIIVVSEADILPFIALCINVNPRRTSYSDCRLPTMNTNSRSSSIDAS